MTNTSTHLSLVWRKPLDNPQTSKPADESAVRLAGELEDVLRRLPSDLQECCGERFPLLSAVQHVAGDLARELIFIAVRVHTDADERRTAEYLLRRRADIADGTRTGFALLAAASRAAEMDVRRVALREIPVLAEAITARPAPAIPERPNDPSVGEVVAAYLYRATGHRPTTRLAHSRLLDAVAVAVELAERHSRNNGTKPSLLAMRSGARTLSRLATHLRNEFDDAIAGRSLARLLVGGDGTPITSALLWWAAHPSADPADITRTVRNRWVRDLADADPSVRAISANRRRLVPSAAGG